MSKDTKPRLYFTCAIKAAYMAKEFEVKLNIRVSAKSEISNYIIDTESMLRDQDQPPFYVALESEEIFLPKKDDWGKIKDMPSRFVKFNGANEWKEIHGGGYRAGIDASEIIMRDNKQFFMPEVEND